MENKLISRVLFGTSIAIFVITFYFFYGMITNGAPKDYDPAQLGVELINKGEASNADFMEKGQEVYEQKVGRLEGNISNGIGFLQVVLYIAAGLMLVFLVYGLYVTVTTDLKKALPSLIFVGITGITFLLTYMFSGTRDAGLDFVLADKSAEEAADIVSITNFWVNGVLIVLIPGFILLVVDLVKGIIRNATN